MMTSADNHSKASALESFYKDYIARTEELRAAIQREDWVGVGQFVAWREQQLARLSELPSGEGALDELHKEYLSRIMVLEAANISLAGEIMETYKALIRETQDHMRCARYIEHS